MSQFADGGLMASKPYVATGKYIERMSPHCAGCRYDPAQRSGDSACPFTTLYWDFLMRHEAVLAKNPRMALQVKNVVRMDDAQRAAVAQRAQAIRRGDFGCRSAAPRAEPAETDPLDLQEALPWTPLPSSPAPAAASAVRWPPS
jgi:deoxyribodipyrimidine photolyase-related protein